MPGGGRRPRRLRPDRRDQQGHVIAGRRGRRRSSRLRHGPRLLPAGERRVGTRSSAATRPPRRRSATCSTRRRRASSPQARTRGSSPTTTYNAENLAPSDPAAKFEALAHGIVTNLATPDIVAVAEVQDDTGATDDGVGAAGQAIVEHDFVEDALAVDRKANIVVGVSQVLDHILVSSGVHGVEYEVVHINAEYADQVSDHDPQVVRLQP
jgi:hypothetical protein